MNFIEKHFNSLCTAIEKIQKTTKDKKYIENRKTNLQLLITFLIPLIFSGSMVYAYTQERSRMYAEFWLFGNDFQSYPKLHLFFMFLYGSVYHSCFLNSSILVVTYASFCNIIEYGILYNMNFSNAKKNYYVQ